MGFDNECILNIQSLAGEYFCPVCRLLVYPSEALQSQCTHLYCKPCLSYVVGTTKACPYDGYLVTEADSKPLIESNKALAETIEKIAVHCLYHRSGCTWQGSLSECTAHCAGCTFGNSPVVCNRCGTQIVHRQVQEHAQSCPGVQPQPQQPDSAQDATAASTVVAIAQQNQMASQQNQAATKAGIPASQAQSTQVAATVAPASGQDQSKVTTSTQPQAAVTSAPTPEQWYQQQQQHYQQYYQNYPGYDPYQQQYQHYVPYQQAHPATVQGQQQPQPQPQVRPQAQSQQPQLQSQSQPQVHPQMQQMSSRPPIQGQPHSQLYPQARPQPQAHPVQLQPQPYMQQRPQVPHSQLQLPQSQPLSQPIPQSQPHMHAQSQMQPQVPIQPPPRSLPQPHSQHPHVLTQHPPAQAVTGHQSYPQAQPYQKVLPGALPQLPHHIHPQQGITQQPTVMRPPQARAPMQHPQASPSLLPPQGQRPNMLPVQQHPVRPQIHHPGQGIQHHPGMPTLQQQPAPQQNQQLQGHLPHPQAFPGQTPGLVQNQSHPPGPLLQHQAMQPQIRAQGPPASSQQNNSTAFGMQPHQSQHHAGRPMVPNSGVSHQKFQQSTSGTAQPKPVQPNGVQPASSQSYPPGANTQAQSPSAQVSKKVEPIRETGPQNNDAKEVAPSRELAGGTKDPSVPSGSQGDKLIALPEERYTKVPEDGYNQLSEERFKPFSGEPNRHIADQREFDEDLKQFPRAGHLDAERFPGYESYPSSRPLDRGPYGNHDVGPKLDGPSGAGSRLPPYHSANPSARTMMPVGFPNENMGRKGDPAVAHPDFLRPYESGRHMPPPRSPGREFPMFISDGIDGRDPHVFGERYKSYLPSGGSEFQESRYPQLPGHLRRGVHDGTDILRGVEPGGPRHFSNHMHMGEPAGFDPFPNPLRMGGPGNLPPDMLGEVGHGRIGDIGYNGGFPFTEHQIDSGYYHPEEESFDQSRKRKQGSMGWCRICKVDCQTVEGLEAHSQTRDHQKMAMDMVLNIKKNSAKKQKLSSDDNISHEDTNKSRKGNFDNRGNRH
ncbi:trithorax group protein osa-like [Papaver somniferum]|uniref:trithorax group protein osa-like n=1 Tax=Papaver somniferum TaxID=3469 RepID=UPI000E6FCE8F|nr:trithorax group protein osa-like [Papaver somniferum]